MFFHNINKIKTDKNIKRFRKSIKLRFTNHKYSLGPAVSKISEVAGGSPTLHHPDNYYFPAFIPSLLLLLYFIACCLLLLG